MHGACAAAAHPRYTTLLLGSALPLVLGSGASTGGAAATGGATTAFAAALLRLGGIDVMRCCASCVCRCRESRTGIF